MADNSLNNPNQDTKLKSQRIQLNPPNPADRAIELAKPESLSRLAKRPDILIGEKEARRGGRSYVNEQVRDTPLYTKTRSWFSITLNTSADKPPLRLRFGKITGGLVLLIVLLIMGLAMVGTLNFFFGGGLTVNGDSLAFQNSAAVREQQRQQVIDLQSRKLGDLQEENRKRLLEISELEGQLQELTNSINSLKGVAKQLQDLLGAAGNSSNSQIPPVPAPTVKGIGSDSSQYIPPIRVAGGYIDPVQGQKYLSQFNSLLGKIDGFSQLLNNRRKSLTDYDVQLATYQQDLFRERIQLNSTTINLTQLSKISDGDAAPSIMPWPGPITSPWGWRMSPFRVGYREFHYGIDIGEPEGTPVQSTKAGIVTYIGFDPGYGNMLEITHAGGWLTRYAHNSRIIAKLGQTVLKGDIIALAGNTGASTGPHIHYEIHKNGVPVDPAQFIAGLSR